MAVHAGDLIRILATHCTYGRACLRGAADHIGQIELSLTVTVVDLLQPALKSARRTSHKAGIDLGNLALGLRCIGFFNDGGDSAFSVTQYPTIA